MEVPDESTGRVGVGRLVVSWRAHRPAPRRRSFAAIWMHATQIKTPAQADAMIAKIERANLNTVFILVWYWGGQAYLPERSVPHGRGRPGRLRSAGLHGRAVSQAGHPGPRVVRQRLLRLPGGPPRARQAPRLGRAGRRGREALVRFQQARGPPVPERPDDRVPPQVRRGRHPLRLHPLRAAAVLLRLLPEDVRPPVWVRAADAGPPHDPAGGRRHHGQSAGQADHRRGPGGVLRRHARHRDEQARRGDGAAAELACGERDAARGGGDRQAHARRLDHRRRARSTSPRPPPLAANMEPARSNRPGPR